MALHTAKDDKQVDPATNEQVAMLGISALGGVGYWTLRKLYELQNGFASILASETAEAFKAKLTEANARPKRTIDWDTLRLRLAAEGATRLQQLTAKGIRLLLTTDAAFPMSLRQIQDPPYWIFVAGNAQVLAAPSVAVVGTRNPSADGMFLANFVGACLPLIKAPTVSGLATGIDQIIHEASIRYGVPTIAVLGTGILREFPKGSNVLREKILRHGGAVVSEYLPQDTYSAQNFVRRNRIQAGLARVVVPIEWQVKGGTAHTVRYARQSDRSIVCLRMPDWVSDRPELALAAKIGGSVHTIPGNEAEFRAAILDGLACAAATASAPSASQLALF